MRKKIWLLAAVVTVMVVAGCQSARELHYFRSGGNYYRLQVKEKSFASKSRYLSGYFDEKAVDRYFSEMSQPDSFNTMDWISKQNADNQSKLVLILSTNSKSIAEQIGNLASNEDLLENIALLANKDKVTQGRKVANDQKQLELINSGMAKAADVYFTGIDTGNARSNIKDFLHYLKTTASGTLVLGSRLDSAISKYQ